MHKSLIGVTGGSGGRRENSVLVNHLAFWMFHKRQFFAGFFFGGRCGVWCGLYIVIAHCHLQFEKSPDTARYPWWRVMTIGKEANSLTEHFVLCGCVLSGLAPT